jgi:hypothetical protein
VLSVVALYGVAMVVAPHLVSDRIFGPLGFGLDRVDDVEAGELDYVAFVFRVLGAVIVGWMVALAGVAAGPLRRRERWAWWTVTGSMAVWFTLDTGMSLAVGEYRHGAFNVAFLIPVVLPLLAIKRTIT